MARGTHAWVIAGSFYELPCQRCRIEVDGTVPLTTKVRPLTRRRANSCRLYVSLGTASC